MQRGVKRIHDLDRFDLQFPFFPLQTPDGGDFCKHVVRDLSTPEQLADPVVHRLQGKVRSLPDFSKERCPVSSEECQYPPRRLGQRGKVRPRRTFKEHRAIAAEDELHPSGRESHPHAVSRKRKLRQHFGSHVLCTRVEDVPFPDLRRKGKGFELREDAGEILPFPCESLPREEETREFNGRTWGDFMAEKGDGPSVHPLHHRS